jgi:hypothetical protein
MGGMTGGGGTPSFQGNPMIQGAINQRQPQVPAMTQAPVGGAFPVGGGVPNPGQGIGTQAPVGRAFPFQMGGGMAPPREGGPYGRTGGWARTGGVPTGRGGGVPMTGLIGALRDRGLRRRF